MSLSRSIHLLDGLPPRAGALTLPIAVGVHSSEKIALAKNVMVTRLLLMEPAYGWSVCILARPAAHHVILWPAKPMYVVEDLVKHWEDAPEEPLPPGQFTLHADVLLYVAKYEGNIGDPDEEPTYELRHLTATREIVIA